MDGVLCLRSRIKCILKQVGVFVVLSQQYKILYVQGSSSVIFLPVRIVKQATCSTNQLRKDLHGNVDRSLRTVSAISSSCTVHSLLYPGLPAHRKPGHGSCATGKSETSMLKQRCVVKRHTTTWRVGLVGEISMRDAIMTTLTGASPA